MAPICKTMCFTKQLLSKSFLHVVASYFIKLDLIFLVYTVSGNYGTLHCDTVGSHVAVPVERIIMYALTFAGQRNRRGGNLCH